jgi:hypothetical protein
VGATTTIFRHSLSQKEKARWLDWRKNTTTCANSTASSKSVAAFNWRLPLYRHCRASTCYSRNIFSRLLRPIRAIASYWHLLRRTLARSLAGATTRIRMPPPPGASTRGYVTLGKLGPACRPHLPPVMAAFLGGAHGSVGSLVKTRFPYAGLSCII